MRADSPVSPEATRPARGWRPWLRLSALAGALLLLSEALWLWQTWPVREVLQPSAPVRSTGVQ